MSTALVAAPAAAPKILCAQQEEIRIAFNENGDATIIQRRWPDDEDSKIHISDEICDALGVPAFGGSR